MLRSQERIEHIQKILDMMRITELKNTSNRPVRRISNYCWRQSVWICIKQSKWPTRTLLMMGKLTRIMTKSELGKIQGRKALDLRQSLPGSEWFAASIAAPHNTVLDGPRFSGAKLAGASALAHSAAESTRISGGVSTRDCGPKPNVHPIDQAPALRAVCTST